MAADDGKTQMPAVDAPWVLFMVFLRLGMTSFGGPVAHMAYFRDEFVNRRGWFTEQAYAELVALCQFLPGPASSQVGMAVGLARGGLSGAVAAWSGFTLPSAMVMGSFAVGLSTWAGVFPVGALHGLKVVAVAVVAQAVWGMGRQLCTDFIRLCIAMVAAGTVWVWPGAWGQVVVIVAAAVLGIWLLHPRSVVDHDPLAVNVGRGLARAALVLFFGLLLGLPALLQLWPNHALALANDFYRAGSLVFGGGHVVLPLLQATVVQDHRVSNEVFMAGYGLAQAMPGPLFSFAAFLGASMGTVPNGWLGAVLCQVVIFVPALLLTVGVLPFWVSLRRSATAQAALSGVNAAVVGLLLAAFCHPVWTSAIFGLADVCMAGMALVALVRWKVPPWLVVLGSGLAGWVVSLAAP